MKANKMITTLFVFLLTSLSLFSQKNEISIPDVSIVAGKSINLPIYLDNTEDIVAVQFTLELAEGFSLEPASATLTERATAHSLVMKEIAHNKYMAMIFSISNTPIVGRTGVLLYVPLSAQSSMPDQVSYPMTLSDVVIAGITGDNLTTDSHIGDITVSASADFELSNVTVNTQTLTPNDKLVVNWQVANVGGLPSTAGWKENVYLDAVNGYSKYIGTVYYDGTLNVNGVVSRTAEFILPAELGVEGDATIRVKLVANSDAGEYPWYNFNNEASTPNTLTISKVLLLQPATLYLDEKESATYRWMLIRSGSTESSETFALTTTPDSRIALPESITILSGQSGAYIDLRLTANVSLDNDSLLTLYVSGENYEDITGHIIIIDDTYPILTAQTNTTSIQEGSVLVLSLTAQRAANHDVEIKISSDISNAFDIPSNILLPAGQTSVEIPIPTIDDDEPNPDRTCNLSLSAAQYQSTTIEVNLSDNDIPELQLTLTPNAISEAAGPLSVAAKIVRKDNIDKKLTIRLYDDSEGAIYYGGSEWEMPAGVEEINVNVGPIDNAIVDGERTYNITAAIYSKSCSCNATIGESLGIATAPLTIYDNDGATLSATTSASVLQEGGELTITVSHNTTTDKAITVAISSDYTDLEYPATVVIPAGESSATFVVKSNSNTISNDEYTAVMTLSADGFATANAWFMVSDQTLPDAQIKSISVSHNEVYPGDTINLSAIVVNTGSYPLAAATKIQYYLNTQLLSSLVLPSALQNGDSILLHSQAVIPAIVGGYNLYAQVNEDKAVKELNYNNNTSNVLPITVVSPYSFDVTIDKAVYQQGDTVVISGHLYGNKITNQSIELYVINDGIRHKIPLTTDDAGAFQTFYIPAIGQMGRFVVGACYPGENLHDELAAFDVYGLKRVDNNYITCETHVNELYVGKFSVENPSTLSLSGVQVKVVSKPEHCQVEVNCPHNIEGGQIVDIQYSVNSTETTSINDWEKITLEITTNEGATLSVVLYHYCSNHIATLKASISKIQTTMTMGVARPYSFTIKNVGKGETGKIMLVLPAWMSTYTPIEMPSLASGETAEIILKLQTTENMQPNIPLIDIIGINCENGNGLALPYYIEPVSDSTGVLIVDVCDEYTYYAEGAPHLQGAKVTITHPTRGDVVAEGLTNANGVFSTELPSGYYAISVTADKHESYRNNLIVDPGKENKVIINLSINGITVDWNVVETEVEDEYEIETIVEFETNVPIPVVTLSMPDYIPVDDLGLGESLLFNAILTNKGLITAEDVHLLLPNVEGLKFETLGIQNLFDLAPQQSKQISVKVTVEEMPSQVVSRDYASRASIRVYPCIVPIGPEYYWDCGPDRKWHRYRNPLRIVDICVELNLEYDIPEFERDTIVLPPPPPPIVDIVIVPIDTLPPPPPPIFPNVDCEPCQNRFLLNLVDCAIAIETSFFPGVGCAYGLSRCAANVDMDVNINKQHNMWTVAGCLASAVGCVPGPVGIGATVVGCLISILEPCKNGLSSMNASRRLNSEYDTNMYEGEADYIVDFKKTLLRILDGMYAYEDILKEYLGEDYWLENTNSEEISALLQYITTTNDELLNATDCYMHKPQGITNEQFERFIERINNTKMKYNNLYIDSDNYIDFSKINDYLTIVREVEEESIRMGYLSTEDMLKAKYDDLMDNMNESSNSVCSTISLKFSQQMVMTRQAFRGTLTVFNGSENTAMENVRLTLNVTDESGKQVTSHEFQINLEDLQGFGGEKTLESAWTLDAQQEGVATILFIPTKYAAPIVDKVYSFGGTLSYTDPFTGLEVTRTLHPVSLTVKPSPNLDLTYFMQRDVIGDDPLTEAIEPCKEAEFSLLINNVGYGDAKNVRMTTNQPEIIDNEKGLLIDFEIISSQLNGQEKVMALGSSVDTDFGNIPAQSTSYAQWWLKSSLLGHFTEYNVEATHVTSYGNPDLTLLNEVTIHELIRSVDASSNNQLLVGFMANDIVDAEDMPDMMYLSNGLVEEVAIAQSATITKQSATEYVLSVKPSQSGWNYGSTSDPTYGLAELKSITRQSDGKSISLRNIWQTDRTLRDGKDPLYENRIHFVDDVTTTTESYLLTFEPVPELHLEISSFDGVPAEGVVLSKPLDKLTVTFNKTIDPITFTAEDITLSVQGEKADVSQVVLTTKDNQTFTIDLSKVADNTQNGYHVLSVQTNTIIDTEGYTGRNGKSTNWLAYNTDGITLQTSVYPEKAGSIKCSYVDADNNTMVSNVVDYGTTVTLFATPAEGYKFVNWTVNGETVSTTPTMEYVVLNDDVQVVANFKEKMYAITIDSEMIGGAVEGVVSGIYPFGTVFAIQPIPEYGYTFSHWLINDVNVGTNLMMDITVNQQMTISAQFVREIYTQRLVAYQGWKWLSSYLQEPIPVEEFTDMSNHIVSQLDEIIKDPIYGLVGGFESLEGGVAYKVQSSMAFARVLEGHLYDVNTNPITLHTGWNWIGYPYYEERSLTAIQNPTEGDYITAQEGFAEFADGYWQGSISSLTPGVGYLYKSVNNKQLAYSFAANVMPAYSPKKHIITANDEQEEIDIHQYPNTMNVTAKLYNGNSEMTDDFYTIYAMCGNECRGVGVAVGDYYYITIYGEEIVDISFVIENLITGEIYVANEMLTFNGDIVGSRNAPYIIDVAAKAPTKLEDTESGMQSLTIYTILGVLLNEDASLVDLQTLPQGLYIVGGQKYYVK